MDHNQKLKDIENLINSDPTNIKLDTCLYFLRFSDNPELRYNLYEGAFIAKCWWNHQGCTYEGLIWFTENNIDTTIAKLRGNN